MAAPVVNQATAGLITELLIVNIETSLMVFPELFRYSAKTVVVPEAITVICKKT